MPANTTHFKKTATNLKHVYQYCYLLAIAPLNLSITLIGFGSAGFGLAGFGSAMMGIESLFLFIPSPSALAGGVLSLPVTIAVTPITIAAGLIAALANTLWGCFALPIAGLRDALRPASATAARKYSATSEELVPLIDSSQKMLENMPKGNSSNPDKTQDAGLPEPSLVENSTVSTGEESEEESEEENSQTGLTEEESHSFTV